MSELARLLRFVRPYTPHLLGSVVLMLIVGASQGLVALLIKPVFDRVLNPNSPDSPVPLFKIPGHTIYLNQLVPPAIHNVWTMVAAGILGAYILKGICDYFGNYLINYVGLSAVTDLRQRVFDRVLRQDSQFFESTSTGRLMSSIMNDIEKIQVATSHILADWLRQSFTAVFLLCVVLQMDWRLALFSLTVLPFVLVPTARLGRRIRRSTRRAQDAAADLNQILQETISGHQVVKSFGTEEIESNRFHVAAARLKSSNLRYIAQQAIASPLIDFFAAITIVVLLTYARQQILVHALTAGEFTSFIIALLLLYEPVKRLTGIHNIFQQALGASQKVFEYLDGHQHVQERPGAVKLNKLQHAIRLNDVSFRYPNSPNG
ncbi:MAG: ABC transporter transmembrane domain-containing protein, partial [Bryobacteraceae bacterium]